MEILVDGDILKYRAGFAAEKGEYLLSWQPVGDWTEPNVESYTYKKDVDKRIANLGLKDGEYTLDFARVPEPVENALHNTKSILSEIAKALHADLDELTIFLSGATNFREDIATIRGYKENRKEQHRPVHGPAIVEYLQKNFTTVTSDGEEADDVMGYTQYEKWSESPDSSVIVSTDKDLDMIPGLHYNFVKEEFYYVDTVNANRAFYTQLLTGDATDNIQGCPGIGSKKAEKLLAVLTDERSMYDAVREAYYNAVEEYDPDEDLLENARLIWIRRRPNEIWTPPEGQEDI